jgi:hypothetical protein
MRPYIEKIHGMGAVLMVVCVAGDFGHLTCCGLAVCCSQQPYLPLSSLLVVPLVPNAHFWSSTTSLPPKAHSTPSSPSLALWPSHCRFRSHFCPSLAHPGSSSFFPSSVLVSSSFIFHPCLPTVLLTASRFLVRLPHPLHPLSHSSLLI